MLREPCASLYRVLVVWNTPKERMRITIRLNLKVCVNTRVKFWMVERSHLNKGKINITLDMTIRVCRQTGSETSERKIR